MGDRLGGREAEPGEIGGQITDGQGEERVAVEGGMRRRQPARETEHRERRRLAGLRPAPARAGPPGGGPPRPRPPRRPRRRGGGGGGRPPPPPPRGGAARPGRRRGGGRGPRRGQEARPPPPPRSRARALRAIASRPRSP